jgi:hypothetical protein
MAFNKATKHAPGAQEKQKSVRKKIYTMALESRFEYISLP